jgi:CRP-like cAMP-binding protein
VGELAVLSGRPRNATVVAETELGVLVLTHRGLGQLLDDIPGMAKHLLYEVTARIVEGSPDAVKGSPDSRTKPGSCCELESA